MSESLVDTINRITVIQSREVIERCAAEISKGVPPDKARLLLRIMDERQEAIDQIVNPPQRKLSLMQRIWKGIWGL